MQIGEEHAVRGRNFFLARKEELSTRFASDAGSEENEKAVATNGNLLEQFSELALHYKHYRVN